MVKSLSKIMMAAFPLVFMGSCYYDNYSELHPAVTATPCDTAHVISYSADIVPLLNNSCGTNNSCHGTSNTSRINLTTYAGVNTVATDGRLVASVIWDGSTVNMPENSTSKISVCDQVKIQKWVAAGSLNN